MPRTYERKTPVLTPNKMQTYAKKILDEAKNDRTAAKEAYKFFKDRVEADPEDDASKKAMTDCLKLAQTSSTPIVKTLELLIKIDDMKERNKPMSSVPDLFESLQNE